MATELLSLFAKIGIDDKEYNKGIEGAESKASKLAKGMKTAFRVGAAAVGVTAVAIGGLSKAIYSAAKETAIYGDTIDKQSQRVGLSAEAYQKWDYVMKIAGTEMGNMRIGLKTMTNQLDQARKGSADAQENFAKLGISMDELNNMSREEAFGAVIKGFQGMEDSTERAALANKMFGRSGQELTPLFNQSAESTDELIKKAEDYGMIMSNDAVKASAEFQDSLTTLSQTSTGLKNRLTAELLPGITSVTDGLALMFTSGGQEEGLEKFTEGLSTTIDNVVNMIPKIVEIGVPIIETVATGIIDNLPKLADAVIQIVLSLGTYVIENLPKILEVGISIILALVQGITENIDSLIPAVVQVVTELATMLTEPDMLMNLINAALELILALTDGLIEALPALMDAVPVIIGNLITAIIKMAPQLAMAALQLIIKLAGGLILYYGKIIEAAVNIGKKVRDKVKDMISRGPKQWGKDMLDTFVSGIKERVGKITDTIKGVANTIKSYLHFSVPDVGPLADADTWMPDFMDLLSSGIDANKFKVTNAIDGLAGDMVLGGGYYGDSYETVNDTQQFEFTFAEGNAPLLQIARLLFPYMQVVSKEKGAV